MRINDVVNELDELQAAMKSMDLTDADGDEIPTEASAKARAHVIAAFEILNKYEDKVQLPNVA